MTILLQLSDFTPYKSITSNADLTKLTMYVNEAQEFDLRQLLGTELYEDFLNEFFISPSLSQQAYHDLWFGCKYIIPGNNTTPTKTFTHEGLKPVLIYFSYARYLLTANLFSTPSGMVTKKDDYSVAITDKQLSRLVNQANSGAQAYWNRTRKYIIDNISLFPLYRYITPAGKGGGVKIGAIGGNSSLRDQMGLLLKCRYCGGYCGGLCDGWLIG